MASMIDASCPRCHKRYGWSGSMLDKPPCPRCGFREPQEELEEADQEMRCVEQLLLDSRREKKRTLELILQAVVLELLDAVPDARLEIASGYLRSQQVPYSSRMLQDVVSDMVARSKTCPKCKRCWPEDQLLMRCATCEEEYCSGCRSTPSVHKFDCPSRRHKT